jgi:acyl-CoA synthetase (AMP-forming)/AMP-acid ligase II
VLPSLILAALREHAANVSVADDRGALTYQELDTLSAAAAALLRPALPALPAGDRPRVGLRAANSTGYVVAYLGLLRAGCVPFLLDSASSATETAAIAADCGLDLLLHEENTAVPGADRVATLAGLALSAFAGPAERPALTDSTEVCRFTSGSTGRPTCIEFSGRAVHRAAANWASGTALAGGDRIACFASLSNGLAFNTSLLAAFLTGAQLHLIRGLPTAGQVVRALERSEATRLVAFPALYESLVGRGARGAGFRGLRMAISSAAPLRPETRLRFTELTGVPVHNYYGVAETGPLTFATDPLTDPGLGPPLPGVSLRAADGAVEVRSESMGTRYLNAPGTLAARTTPDGYYRTGDVGHLVDGSLVLTGRTGHMINVGGRKVDPLEVAEVLRGADGVRDAVVLEVADRHGGTALGAVLAGEPPPDPSAMRRHASARLPLHKVPSLLRTVPTIPRGSAGKPALAELRRLFEQPDPR